MQNGRHPERLRTPPTFLFPPFPPFNFNRKIRLVVKINVIQLFWSNHQRECIYKNEVNIRWRVNCFSFNCLAGVFGGVKLIIPL